MNGIAQLAQMSKEVENEGRMEKPANVFMLVLAIYS